MLKLYVFLYEQLETSLKYSTNYLPNYKDSLSYSNNINKQALIAMFL